MELKDMMSWGRPTGHFTPTNEDEASRRTNQLALDIGIASAGNFTAGHFYVGHENRHLRKLFEDAAIAAEEREWS